MKDAMIAFARAVGWGTLAGAAPYMALIFVPMAFSYMAEASIFEIVVLFAYPLFLSGAMVLGSALLFGLPLTFFLSEQRREHGGTYALTGLILGALVPLVINGALGGRMEAELLFFAIPGAFAGLVTGVSWGRWREARSR
ncbi:hypothetical protein [Porphyrobacter sp. HT-58-2]|uniref:hypothetical protein n=1 Tax=Porphyrobacter sp. HT-58-2 TaxID=2023229 RepID=UPI0011B03BF5|nr:hypothetical protein [Porphyrobacter sp. HT-58-2]